MNELHAAEGPATPRTAALLAKALAALAADAIAARLCAASPWSPMMTRRDIHDAVAADWSTKWSLVQLADEAAPVVGRIHYLARLGLRDRHPTLLALGDTYMRRRKAPQPLTGVRPCALTR